MTNETDNKILMNRRRFMQAGLTLGAAGITFSSMAARAAAEGQGYGFGNTDYAPDYGPLSVKPDMATGLYLLALPEGFEYLSFGWTGSTMADGRPTPTDHDGMAVCAHQGHRIALVRNHELSAGEGHQCLVDGGMYNSNEFGGTTNLVFDLKKGEFVESYTSLGGTIRNCAGGKSPWGTWISCEETFHDWNNRGDGYNHGYVFEVPAFGISNGVPIRAAGRFSHEAVAFDPNTGVMYETEDTGNSGFYKYVAPGCGHNDWRSRRNHSDRLEDGGELYAMVVDGIGRADMSVGFSDGDTFDVSWERVTDPEGMFGRPFDSAPNAAIFSRGEGCWEENGMIYFVSTNGGAAGLGQVWVYNPRSETVTLMYESRSADDCNGPDNIAISDRGGIILCEDGSSNPKRLIGLSRDGVPFTFAENHINLEAGDVEAIDAVYPGTYDNFTDSRTGNSSSREWCGATFYGDWLFANIQSPGVTFAIRGPWKKGAL